MKMIIKGERVYYGLEEDFLNLPIVNLPSGTIRVRRRARVDKVCRVYVKLHDGIQEWIAGPNGAGGIRLLALKGQNKLIKNA